MLSSLLLELDCYIRMYSYASIPLKAFKPQYMNKLCSVPVISTPLLSLLSINSPAANYQLAVLKKPRTSKYFKFMYTYTHNIHSFKVFVRPFLCTKTLCLCQIIYTNAWEIAQSHACLYISLNPHFSTHTYFAATPPSIYSAHQCVMYLLLCA